MFKVDKYPQGTFCWSDNASTDMDAGKAFYAAVMGWETEDLPLGDDMFYTYLKHAGEPIVGIGPMMPDMQAQGIPSHWTSYVSVDEIEPILSKVAELGGTPMMEPMDIFESGRMAVFQDPVGATIGLWQPKQFHGGGLVNTPGAMCWNELMTREPEKARDFYGKLFGWEFNKDERGYIMILNNGRPNGGILGMDESYAMPSAWQTYFSVADIDSAIDRVKANGGSIHIGKTEAPGVGHFAMIGDPTGSVCTVIQMKEPQPWDV